MELKIVLDEKTKAYLETMIAHKDDFYQLYNNIAKSLTPDDENTVNWKQKLKTELDEAFDWMSNIYNTYKE